MKIILKNLFRTICFMTLLSAILFYVNRILILKGVEHGHYSPVSQQGGFYQMERNSVDVLFLGSSHCYCALSPQELYNQYNIRGYNLGSSMQNVWLSYYWLEEALRFQKPEVVVLEAYMFSRVGSDEPYIHRALSFMQWSVPKIKALEVVGQKHPQLTYASFIFSNIRFHERWKELTAEDFTYTASSEDTKLKGYLPIGEKYGQDDYRPLKIDSEEMVELDVEIENYLDKIVDLCNQNNIELVFLKIPTLDWTVKEHNAYNQYAKENGIGFVDYNIEEEYLELGYDFSEDSFDYGHANIWGADKLARSFGKILRETYGVSGVKDEQWEQSNQYVEAIKEEYRQAFQ